MKVSRKTRGYNKLQRGEVGQPAAAALLYGGRSGRQANLDVKTGTQAESEFWETGRFLWHRVKKTITHQNIPDSCSCK